MPTIEETFRTFSACRMRRSASDIDACLARLTGAQMFHRNAGHENSIANLLLHLASNIRQWILHGIDDQPDVRTRDAEFSLQPAGSIDEIRTRFRSTLEEACQVILAVPAERLLVVIDPQPGNGAWPPMTILEAVMQIVGHLQYHTGQIVFLTKQLTGADLDLTLPRKR